MPKGNLRLTRIFRFLILLFLSAVVIVIAANFLSRSKRQPKIPQISDEISPQKIEQKDKVQYFEDKKGRLYRLIKAERHYVGPDALNYLEGNVEIVFLRAADGQDVHLSGGEIIYDAEGKHFKLKGNTEVKFKDTMIKASFLEYLSEQDIIKSNQGIQVESKRFSGTASIFEYRFEKEELILKKDVKLRLLPNFEPSAPIYARADKMDYRHKKGTGIFEGHVGLSFKENQATADQLRFELTFNKEHIKSMALQGHVSAQLVSKQEVDSGDKQDSTGTVDIKREIKADELAIRNFQHSMAARDIQMNGNCHYLMVSSSGESREIQADSMMLNFTQQGKLKAFSATGSVDMTEKREAGSEKRYIQGDSMMIEEGRKVALNVKGGEGIPAAIVSGGYKIEAGEINVLMNSNNLEATGGIKVTIDPINEKQSKVGFFQEEASIFLVANEMRYSGEAKRFLFKDRVKIWQGKDMVLTEELALFRDTGKILCSRGVTSFIAFTPKAEDADYQVGIEAESLAFNPKESLIAYQGNSSLKVKDINLHADSLLVFLNKDTGRMQKITARGNVSIQRAEYEGLGQEAIYDIEEENVVLTGSPVLMDKTRGRTEGDKLTFHISDGRIIVENKGRERSVSVIKS